MAHLRPRGTFAEAATPTPGRDTPFWGFTSNAATSCGWPRVESRRRWQPWTSRKPVVFGAGFLQHGLFQFPWAFWTPAPIIPVHRGGCPCWLGVKNSPGLWGQAELQSSKNQQELLYFFFAYTPAYLVTHKKTAPNRDLLGDMWTCGPRWIFVWSLEPPAWHFSPETTPGPFAQRLWAPFAKNPDGIQEEKGAPEPCGGCPWASPHARAEIAAPATFSHGLPTPEQNQPEADWRGGGRDRWCIFHLWRAPHGPPSCTDPSRKSWR